MISLRKSDERGSFDHGWLRTSHTFSFADYQDPRFPGYRKLRVINEDYVAPGQGFGSHPHRDMEILTYVLSGALQHKDSMGNGSIIRPGEVQYMSAGDGVLHSEFNASQDEEVHLLQIWILPDVKGATPRYDQKAWTDAQLKGKLVLVASPDGKAGSIAIRQNAQLFAARLDKGAEVGHAFGAGRAGWLQVAKGAVTANGTSLAAGDGASFADEAKLAIRATAPGTEILLFDLP